MLYKVSTQEADGSTETSAMNSRSCPITQQTEFLRKERKHVLNN